MESKTLRSYQQESFLHLFWHVMNGQREVVLCGPQGSGKSLMATYLAERLLATMMFRSAVTIAPQCQITDAFTYKEDMEIIPCSTVPQGRVSVGGALTVKADQWYQARQINRKDHFKRHVSAAKPVQQVLVTTHHAVAKWFGLDTDLLPDDMAERLLVVDEAHHTTPENGVGSFVKEWHKKGGSVIHVTATPFRKDGDTLIDDDAPRWTRSLAAHMEGGEYSPGTLDLRTHPMSARASTVNQLAGRSVIGDATSKDCAEVVDLWVKDKRPKAVVIVPPNRAEKWAMPLAKEFERRGARVHNAIKGGVRTTNALKKLLRKEREVKVYKDSTVDVILACARFNEGTDWPLCSHVYNIGLSYSFVLILQRLGRTLRFKGDIKGYPKEHRDRSVFTFLVPNVSEKVMNKFEQRHHDHAFLTACFMADFATGQDYLMNDIQTQLRDAGRQRRGQYRAEDETWEDVVQFIGADIQQCRKATGQMVKAIVLLQKSGVEKPDSGEVLHYMKTVMGLKGEDLERANRAVVYSGPRDGKYPARAFTGLKSRLWHKFMGSGTKFDLRLVRKDLQAIFDEVVAEIEHETANIELAERVVDFMSRFEGRTAEEVASRLRSAMPMPQLTMDQVEAAITTCYKESQGVDPEDTEDASVHLGLPTGIVTWVQVNRWLDRRDAS